MRRVGYIVFAVMIMIQAAPGQGPLAPPAGPAPTMKTLDQIEPRIPISALPFIITNSGSYYVTGHLQAPPGGHGIVVEASHVTVDLGGYTLRGNGGPLSSGIHATGTLINLKVQNGAFANWPRSGVNAGNADNVHAENLLISQAGGYAISAGSGALVRNCVIDGLGGSGAGISVNSGSRVLDCTVAQIPDEGGIGVLAGDNSVISGVTVVNAGLWGIRTLRNGSVMHCSVSSSTTGYSIDAGTIVSHCTGLNNFIGISGDNDVVVTDTTISGSSSTGIQVGRRSVIRNTTSNQGGDIGISADDESIVASCTASMNTNGGIYVGRNVTVENSRAIDNTAIGIYALNNARIFNNTASGNALGIQAARSGARLENNQITGNFTGLELLTNGCFIAGNVVHNNTLNYLIAPGNQLNILLSELPQRISWPAQVTFAGSLYLNGPTEGITLTASNVTIDLNGHALIGNPLVNSDGIRETSSSANITIRNGTIRDWGGYGINALGGTGYVLENLVLKDNANDGAILGDHPVVRDTVAGGNGDDGIDVLNYAVFENTAAHGNTDAGFEAAAYPTFNNCSAYDNNQGFNVLGSGATLTDCKAYQNLTDGINVSFDARVIDCFARSNGGNGIRAGNDSLIADNQANNNGTNDVQAAGIRLNGEDSWVRGNHVEGNPYGIRSSSLDILVTGNFAAKNATNYTLSATSEYGAIVNEPGPDFINSNPWSNFEVD